MRITCIGWVKLSPFIAMLLGFLAAWFYMTISTCPARGRKQHRCIRFLLNKWYFDEIYDVHLCAPAQCAWAVPCGKGDGKIIDGGINGVAMGIIPFFTASRGVRSRVISLPMLSRMVHRYRGSGHLDDACRRYN